MSYSFTDEEIMLFTNAIENAQKYGMIWEFTDAFFKSYDGTNRSITECIFHANREWDL